MDFDSVDCGSLQYHTHWSSSFIQSCWSPFEILLQTATGEQGSCFCLHSWPHALLAR